MHTTHLPVYPTQQVFRVLVDALSHPGRVYSLPEPPPDAPWNTALSAVAQTLLDHEVCFAFIGVNVSIASEVFAATKARQVPVEEADYIIVEGNCSAGQILAAQCGPADYPDQGATILYLLDTTESPEPAALPAIVRFHGPGIQTPLTPQLPGLSLDELHDIQDLNADYPTGVDCLFLGRDRQIMGLPRSTRIAIV